MKSKPSSYSPGLAAYLFKKKMQKIVQSIFLFCIIIGLCFTILYPIIQLVPSVFSKVEDLGNPNVIWLPMHFSIISFKAAIRFCMPEGIMTMVKSILYAAGIMLIQLFFSAMAGYALARVKFYGHRLVFFLVILVFLIPRQSLLLAQYIYFTHFNAFGLLKLFTAAGEVNLINKPFTLVMIAVLGFGVQQSLFIFIFSQFFKNIPNELEEAALIDGCGFHKTYFKIMIPNAIPAISTVAILSFVWNYGDTYYTRYFNKDGPYLSSILATKFADNNKDLVLNAVKVWFNVPLANDFAFDAIKQAAVLIFLIPLLLVYFGAQKWLVENLENSGLVG
ncbi:MAG TPA: carbohydrate ABC transporter permease [Mobilitalea sp.]|nr:carbohydrate ABC transporter permease [Mobilitalea sp.]